MLLWMCWELTLYKVAVWNVTEVQGFSTPLLPAPCSEQDLTAETPFLNADMKILRDYDSHERITKKYHPKSRVLEHSEPLSYCKVYNCSFTLISSPFQLEALCLLFIPAAQQGSWEPLTMALKIILRRLWANLHLLLHTQWDTCIETGTNVLSSNSSLWNHALLFQSLRVLTWNSIIHWKLLFPYFENLPCRLVLSDKCLLDIFRQTVGTS